ncbi:hypothetical protein [Methanosalsum natronophilum]|uniref:hypothetical protein n=1 Tax=Methanosalsum natronophilum TaxID=768733 RepID=UPI00216A97E9|nr:hypothetical protein [Methanosalsum natronophilum]MCS3924050.1 hypothetical protein [Methanosalsum natronophilum]
MSKFHKREAERKGIKKDENFEEKLIHENLDDLIDGEGLSDYEEEGGEDFD